MAFFQKHTIIKTLNLGLVTALIGVFSFQLALAKGDKDELKAEILQSIDRHKKSVVEIGMHALTYFPEYFPALRSLPENLRLALVKSYLELHDNPKLWSLKETLESPHPSATMPLENIVEYWQQEIPESERGWIEELNSRESFYKSNELKNILRTFGIRQTQALILELLNLEDMSDVLDTKLNRWQEMGLKSAPPPLEAMRYFMQKRKLITLAQLVRKVELSFRIQDGAACIRLF